MKNLLLFLFAVLCCSSCTPEDERAEGIPFDGTGYKPIYAKASELENITVTGGQPLVDPGKIYMLDPFIFVNENGKGIHIIDNSDPKKPDNVAFIVIPGNHDIAAKGNWLYADCVSDLLVIDISNPKQPRLTKRIANAIPVANYPAFRNIWFECVDSKNGVVIDWEKVPMSTRPSCYR